MVPHFDDNITTSCRYVSEPARRRWWVVSDDGNRNPGDGLPIRGRYGSFPGPETGESTIGVDTTGGALDVPRNDRGFNYLGTTIGQRGGRSNGHRLTGFQRRTACCEGKRRNRRLKNNRYGDRRIGEHDGHMVRTNPLKIHDSVKARSRSFWSDHP